MLKIDKYKLIQFIIEKEKKHDFAMIWRVHEPLHLTTFDLDAANWECGYISKE